MTPQGNKSDHNAISYLGAEVASSRCLGYVRKKVIASQGNWHGDNSIHNEQPGSYQVTEGFKVYGSYIPFPSSHATSAIEVINSSH